MCLLKKANKSYCGQIPESFHQQEQRHKETKAQGNLLAASVCIWVVLPLPAAGFLCVDPSASEYSGARRRAGAVGHKEICS